MIVTTKAIVLSSIKYQDNHLIVKCFTEKEGSKSYLLRGVRSSKRKKIKSAHFQPLTQLEIVAIHNSKGALNTINEVEVINHFQTVFNDIKKQSIVLFISEILNYSIQEEEKNLTLYKYLESSIIWLDEHSNIANFHMLFLLNLTKYLGFYPEQDDRELPYFDLNEGIYVDSQPRFNFISSLELVEFNKLLGTNFDTIDTIKFNVKNRQKVLSILIQYYELHLNGFRKPKSLEVLKYLFH